MACFCLKDTGMIYRSVIVVVIQPNRQYWMQLNMLYRQTGLFLLMTQISPTVTLEVEE